MLLGLFSAVSLLLAAVGIYGLMRYSVMQRTHEIGVRMALGASPSAVAALVLRQGLLWAIAGVVIGSLSAMFLTRALKGFLFGIGALDPLTFAGVAGVLVAAGAMACYFPARRAATIDPLAALRYE